MAHEQLPADHLTLRYIKANEWKSRIPSPLPHEVIWTLSGSATMAATSPSFVSGLQTSKYTNVAALTVWVYDYLLTLDDEVIWTQGKGWDITRVVFTSARYMPSVGAIMTVYIALQSSLSDCRPIRILANAIHIAGFVATESLLVIRSYAIWQCDKRVLRGLILFAVTIFTGALVESSLVHIPSSYQDAGDCVFANGKESSAIYGFLVVFELVVLVIIIIGGKFHRTSTNRVVSVLFRDGVGYICCIIVISLVNIILVVTFPSSYGNTLDAFQLVLHSIIASRILFNLRKNKPKKEFDTLPPEHSVVQFAVNSAPDIV